MRRLYTFFLYLLIPFILIRLYWKGRKLPAYRRRIGERFSLGKQQAVAVDVWVHAVSLGEVVAAIPLIDELLARSWNVLITTMTPTGSQQIAKRFGDKVLHQYVPYDLPWVIRRFFKTYQPKLGIIMETELWPNLIYQAGQFHLPLLLANARLSDKAFRQYEAVAFMFKPVLQQFAAIFAQSEEDAKRYISLGAPIKNVHMLGNMKFDLQMQFKENQIATQLKNQWGNNRPVVIAASTHDNEENQWLEHLDKLKVGIPEVVLLFAPRHPERFQSVYQLSLAKGYKTGLRSQPDTINETTDVIVIDAMGELLSFYQISDYAFVGGSLVPIGGHNVLEPIAVDVPVFCGPYMNNSKAICHDLCTEKAMIMADDVHQLVEAIIASHQNKNERLQQITNATKVLAANKGTVARYMERIETLMA